MYPPPHLSHVFLMTYVIEKLTVIEGRHPRRRKRICYFILYDGRQLNEHELPMKLPASVCLLVFG